MKIHFNNGQIIAGITLRNDVAPEANNMALYVTNNPDDVIKNREKFARTIGCEISDFVCAEQTHSDHFYKVTAKDRGRGALTMVNAVKDTDALYTYEKDIILTSFSADCVPVTFYHKDTQVIGTIHSGWVGTVKEITYKTLKHLIDNENCSREGFIIHIGMALSQEKFEVDQDVYEQFFALSYANDFIKYKKETNKYHIDNQLVVKKQCELLGISNEQISVDTTCTYQSPLGFSYREDKQAGRHMTFILKK